MVRTMAEVVYTVVYAKCCRYWPVAMGNRIGYCGICGEVPVYDPEMTTEKYMANHATPNTQQGEEQ